MNSVKYGVIVKSVAILRDKPHESSERIDEILFGMDVTVISSEQNGWYYVNTFYDYQGYINGKDILLFDEDEHRKWKDKAIFYVSQSVADILIEPKYNSQIINMVTRGSFISDTGEKEGNWSKIELPNGSFGWIRTEYIKKIIKLSLSEEKLIRENLVETAELYLDVQYRWGGKSPLGIDCSGLCFMAYMLNGFIIYRDAILKECYMKSIEIKEVKKGDLIFFKGHIAMYIDKGKFIHSNGKYGGVCINSFNDEENDYREDLAHSIIAVGSIF